MFSLGAHERVQFQPVGTPRLRGEHVQRVHLLQYFIAIQFPAPDLPQLGNHIFSSLLKH